MEIWGRKDLITKKNQTKPSLDGSNSRTEMTEERVNGLEDVSVDII